MCGKLREGAEASQSLRDMVSIEVGDQFQHGAYFQLKEALGQNNWMV